MYQRCILNSTTEVAPRDPSVCLRVGACRLAGLRTPTTQTEGPSGNDGAAPSLRAVPPGEHDEALTLRCELNFLSASFLRGARAAYTASLSDHGAAPTWGSSGSRARRRSGAGNSSNSGRSANGGSGANGSGASGSDAASRATAIAVDAPEVARACRVGSASNSAGVACGAGTAGDRGDRGGACGTRRRRGSHISQSQKRTMESNNSHKVFLSIHNKWEKQSKIRKQHTRTRSSTYSLIMLDI